MTPRSLVHNWCSDLATDHRPTWWAEQREGCPDCERSPSGGPVVLLVFYLLLLYALLVWGAVRKPEAVPPSRTLGGID